MNWISLLLNSKEKFERGYEAFSLVAALNCTISETYPQALMYAKAVTARLQIQIIYVLNALSS